MKKPRTHLGRVWSGRAGTATEIVIDKAPTVDQTATLASWFLHCPAQSPAWDNYVISLIHLRSIKGQSKSAIIRVPHATHELIIAALDPAANPSADDLLSWRFLRPINLMEQFQVPSDHLAGHLFEAALQALLNGALWAEPPLSGQVEPWASTIIRTSAHLRGEVHAT